MANTYTLISSATVSAAGGASSVVLSSIPQTYTDLKLVCSTRSLRASDEDGFGLLINGTSSTYSWISLLGNGSSASSVNTSVGYGQVWNSRTDGNTATSNTFANTEIYIPNYTSSNYKSYSADAVTENNGTTAYAHLTAVLWQSTSAITSLTMIAGNANLAQYSTFYLYGIKNS